MPRVAAEVGAVFVLACFVMLSFDNILRYRYGVDHSVVAGHIRSKYIMHI